MAANSITKDVFTINYDGSFDETVSVNCSPADWSSPEAKQNSNYNFFSNESYG